MGHTSHPMERRSSPKVASCKGNQDRPLPGGGGGVLPYISYIGVCGPKGYGFSAVLVINSVWILGSGLHTPTQFFWEYPCGATWPSGPLIAHCFALLS